MLTYEKGCCLFHSCHIQFVKTIPSIFSVKNTRYITDSNTIEIFFGFGIVTAMETLRHIVHPVDSNITRQITIQIVFHLPTLHLTVRMKISYLLISMYTSICSSRTDQFDFLSCHFTENILKFSLNRYTVPFSKALPPIISASIILNQQPYISLHILSFHILHNADDQVYQYLSAPAHHSGTSHRHSDSDGKMDIHPHSHWHPAIIH